MRGIYATTAAFPADEPTRLSPQCPAGSERSFRRCSAAADLVEEVHDERYPVSQRLLDRHQDRKALTIRSHRYTTHSFPRMVRDRYGRAAANECVDAVDPSSGNRFPGCERHSLFALWADTFRSAGPCVDRGRDGRAAEVHAPTGSGGQDGKPPGQALKCWALRLGATSRVPPAPSTEIYKHIAVRQVLPLSLPETNPTHAGRAACSSGSGGPHRRPSL